MANAAKQVARIMMCRPTYFEVKYSINPWMNIRGQVDKKEALNQWDMLRKTIESLGAEVLVMEPDADGADYYPDLVFTANAAVVRDKRAYISTFSYPERMGESFFYDVWFKKNGYTTYMDKTVQFEGAGDALWLGEDRTKIFCGIGPRTNSRALQKMKKFLGNDENWLKAYGIRLIDPRFYHIDTCFCPLTDGLALYYPDAFDDVSRYNMSNEIELVPVSEPDAIRFACNAVVIGSNVIMNEGAEETARQLERLGYKTHFVNMSEFMKSGGSTKCCTLTL